MNIKEVEKITGISSQNIRFYEKYELVKLYGMQIMDIVNIMQRIFEN